MNLKEEPAWQDPLIHGPLLSECYEIAEIYTPGYCEAYVLKNTEFQFSSRVFQECLIDIQQNIFSQEELCDYAYPEDDEYFGDINAECKGIFDEEAFEEVLNET